MIHETAERAIRSIEETEELDAYADLLKPYVDKYLASKAVKYLLTGGWYGHPLHPALTDVTIGGLGSSLFLDLFGTRSARRSGDALALLGIASAVPVIASGLVDWSDTYGGERRVGLVHAGINVAGVGLFALSIGSRMRHRQMRSRALRLTGFALLAAGGYLGGHLSFRKGVGVDHTFAQEFPSGWTAACSATDLEEGKPAAVRVGDASIVLVRQGKTVRALANTCSHAGGPLAEGELRGDCLVCPWHGSAFDLETGEVREGPATAPQPALETRTREGTIEVRRKAG